MGDVVPLESAVVRRICKLLDSRGAWYVKTTGVRKVGCPDLLCCYRGRFLAIEVKRAATGYGATPRQEHEIKKICDAGGIAIVAWHERQVEKILNSIDSDGSILC